MSFNINQFRANMLGDGARPNLFEVNLTFPRGFGNVDAVVTKLNYNIPKTNLKTSFSFGYFHLPNVKNYMLNKYGMPSYTQLNADIRYIFSGLCKGLETQLLIVGKFNQGNTYQNDRYIFNKVNMILYNLVINYNF